MKKPFKKMLVATLYLIIGGGCSLDNELPFDSVYYSYEKPFIISSPKKKAQTLEERTFNFNLNFGHRNLFISPSLPSNWDSDLDGIYNWADPWPNKFGPFLDMNQNGIIDWGDIQIRNCFIPIWNPEQYFYFRRNPLWKNYYFPSTTLKENKQNFYYGPRKGFSHSFQEKIGLSMEKKEPSPSKKRKLNQYTPKRKNFHQRKIFKYKISSSPKYILKKKRDQIPPYLPKKISPRNNSNLNSPYQKPPPEKIKKILHR